MMSPWRRLFVLPAVVIAVAAGAVGAGAQVRCDDRENAYCTEIARLAQRPDVVQALRFIEQQNETALRELITLTEIPAPPFGEEVRAAAYAEMLRAAGADSVWTDSIGNVIALRRGAGAAPRRTVAMAGHMDTVFPEGTDVTVRMRGDTLYAPGIGDDTRGLVVVLHVLRAMARQEIRTEADLLFIGTVGEEGLGDLRGVKHLFREGAPRIDSFIAVDGGSDGGITNGALGSRRYRVTFSGPGGHSWGAFGTGNPIHALGRAIMMFDTVAATFTAAPGGRTSYNVGRIGGGTSVNSVPFEAWAEVDMRSVSQERLTAIDSIFRATMGRALAEQNTGIRRGESLSVSVDLVGDRPSGVTEPGTPLLDRAMAATLWLGDEPQLSTSSTDANTPIALGIPAVTIGRGGVGGNTHSPDEWWIDRDSEKAVQRALLILLAEAGG
ncbi:MAG TPA: M20/M25/M40 family metallo-hydrolase [Longimicrobiales bacterium]|nr:M20/M25/M40 family metallo-hydrolase [Longimicrobiales bacterium]